MKPSRNVRGQWRTALALLLLYLGLAGAVRAGDPREVGPIDLAITYEVKPADRTALRALMQNEGLRNFEQWKKAGLLADYKILFSRYPDAPNWDMMALLTFTSDSAATRWKEIERAHPAGLPPKALALMTNIRTTPVDLHRQGTAAQPAAAPVYLVIPYDYLTSTNEYIRYLDGYLVPQVQGWVDEGIVAQYGVYIARYGAGRAWSSLLVIAYRDDDALGSRDRTVAKVRTRLAQEPVWKEWSDRKDKIREERAPVIGDLLTLH